MLFCRCYRNVTFDILASYFAAYLKLWGYVQYDADAIPALRKVVSSLLAFHPSAYSVL